MTFSDFEVSSCNSERLWVEAAFVVVVLDVVDVGVDVGVEVVLDVEVGVDAARIDCPLWSSSFDNVVSKNMNIAVTVSKALKKCYASYLIIIRFLGKFNIEKPNLTQL